MQRVRPWEEEPTRVYIVITFRSLTIKITVQVIKICKLRCNARDYEELVI